MARALPSPSYNMDGLNAHELDISVDGDIDSEDSDLDDDEVQHNSEKDLRTSPSKSPERTSSPNAKKQNHVDLADGDSDGKLQNGTVSVQTDRYGFVGGKEFTDPDHQRRIPIELNRKRELKWLDMFQNWEKWMSKRFKKVKERCRKGIPPSLRSRAWQFLSGSTFIMARNKGKFEEYLQSPGDPRWIDDIKKDLHRQFPLHEIFMSKGGHGQEDLYRVLKAYTVHNPVDGYCQAQGPLAAVLLMHMPVEEAFWCFVSICDKYLPGYYSPGLEAVQLDGDVLFGLLKKSNPAIHKQMKKQRLEPILFMTEWFMCVFSRNLPWTCVLRVWDMFLCEGIKVVFRVALVLVRMCLGTAEKLQASPGMYEMLEKLRALPQDMDESFLVRESLRLSITEREMEKEHQKQIQRRKKAAREKANKGDSSKKTKKK